MSDGSSVPGHGLQLGGCRDRGLYLRKRVLRRRVVGVNAVARWWRRRRDRQRRSWRATTDGGRGALPAAPRPRRPLRRWQHRRARDCGRGDRRTGAANRRGFSMKPQCEHGQSAGNHGRRQPAYQSQRVAQQPPVLAAAPASAKRYHEYDTRPTARIGGNARTRPHPREGVAQPAPITSAVPSTGNSARRYQVRAWLRSIGCSPAGPGLDLPIPVIAAGSAGSRRHWAAGEGHQATDGQLPGPGGQRKEC